MNGSGHSAKIRERFLSGEPVTAHELAAELGCSSALVDLVRRTMIERGAVIQVETPASRRSGGHQAVHRLVASPPMEQQPERKEQHGKIGQMKAAFLAGEMLTADEAAARFGVTRDAVRKAVRRLGLDGHVVRRARVPGSLAIRWSVAPRPEPEAADTPVWVANALKATDDEEPSVAQLQREIDYLRDRVAHLTPEPIIAPEFGAMLQVVGLMLEAGEITCLLQNGKRRFMATLKGTTG